MTRQDKFNTEVRKVVEKQQLEERQGGFNLEVGDLTKEQKQELLNLWSKTGSMVTHYQSRKKVLIIGNMRHGKDTVAEMISDEFGLTHKSSSMAAAEIFIYDQLKESHGYKTFEECYEDRMNHRALWHDLICDYNKEDKSRLAKSILEDCDIYVGMRSNEEVEVCLQQGLFDYVIGVFDPRKQLEESDSFSINIWSKCDFVIPNSGTLKDLRNKVNKLPL